MPRKFQTVVSIIESMPPEDVDYNFVKKKLRSEEEKLSARDNSGPSGVRKAIKSELSAASSVALTTDCWSSRSQQSYITVTAHFIDSTWHTKTVTLSTHEISHRHTADNLATEVQKTEEEWDLITKTTAVVTDNAANVIKSNHQHGLNDPCSYSTGTQDQGQQDAQEQRAKAPRPFPRECLLSYILPLLTLFPLYFLGRARPVCPSREVSAPWPAAWCTILIFHSCTNPFSPFSITFITLIGQKLLAFARAALLHIITRPQAPRVAPSRGRAIHCWCKSLLERMDTPDKGIYPSIALCGKSLHTNYTEPYLWEMCYNYNPHPHDKPIVLNPHLDGAEVVPEFASINTKHGVTRYRWTCSDILCKIDHTKNVCIVQPLLTTLRTASHKAMVDSIFKDLSELKAGKNTYTEAFDILKHDIRDDIDYDNLQTDFVHSIEKAFEMIEAKISDVQDVISIEFLELIHCVPAT
ncbi:hypothetical protein M8J76_015804 [Diaphorina citri]|nr:hypothetical protein M8J76_015804 [Diaphorina citri]